MAYGAWKGRRWRELWNNGYYRISGNWDYCIDPIANKSKISLNSLRVESLVSGYTFHNDIGVTCGFGDFDGKKYAESIPLRVPSGGKWEHEFTNRHSEIQHNGDGSWPSGKACGWWIFQTDINGYNVPNVGWTPFNIDGSVEKIDRTSGSGEFIVSSRHPTYLRMRYKPSVDTDIIRYRVDGGAWKNVSAIGAGQYRYFDVTGLSPNRNYNIECQHRRTYNAVYSGVSTVTTSTIKPSQPSTGQVTVNSSTYNSVEFNVSGFNGSSPAIISYYQYTKNNGSSYETLQNSTVSGLSPDTVYRIGVRAVDNYGTASGTVYVDFRTAKPAAGKAGTVNVTGTTPFTVDLTWSGFTAGSGGSISYYEWCYVLGDTNSGWSRVGTGTSYTMTGLKEESSYLIGVRAVDNYGVRSGEAWVNATTLVDQSKVKIRVNGSARIGRVWININGTAKKSKKIYVNVNGTAKLFTNA